VLNTLPGTKSSGFTLVELIITISIVGILVGLGMPSFLQTIRNAEIRNANESVVNGMQRARAEAVARNANVHFVLGVGTTWIVDYVVKPVASDAALDSRSGNEGSSKVTITALAADLATTATTVTFNNLGQVVANADASATLAQVNLAAVGGNQNLRVTIGAGGNAKACDPGIVSGSSPRAC
jgi:type IV fimbrial biogenesis protein FimT